MLLKFYKQLNVQPLHLSSPPPGHLQTQREPRKSYRQHMRKQSVANADRGYDESNSGNNMASVVTLGVIFVKESGEG